MNNSVNQTAPRYESPTLSVIGSFEEVTQMNHSGAFLDADFAAGTPLSQLTTS